VNYVLRATATAKNVTTTLALNVKMAIWKQTTKKIVTLVDRQFLDATNAPT
jgi:hypothetical protein